jgi:hypothetical protein
MPAKAGISVLKQSPSRALTNYLAAGLSAIFLSILALRAALRATFLSALAAALSAMAGLASAAAIGLAASAAIGLAAAGAAAAGAATTAGAAGLAGAAGAAACAKAPAANRPATKAASNLFIVNFLEITLFQITAQNLERHRNNGVSFQLVDRSALNIFTIELGDCT